LYVAFLTGNQTSTANVPLQLPAAADAGAYRTPVFLLLLLRWRKATASTGQQANCLLHCTCSTLIPQLLTSTDGQKFGAASTEQQKSQVRTS
jgi:hypothetical protein